MGIWQDFFGTTVSFFRLGVTGVRLKDSSGNLQVRNPSDSADAQLTASQLNIGSTNPLQLQKNGSQSGTLTVIYPSAKATDGQVLAQKAGTAVGVVELEFVSTGSTASSTKIDTTSLAFGSTSPVSLFNLPANNLISMVDVIIDTPFNGTPSISIGISGSTSKYVASTQVDLTVAAGTVFRIHPGQIAPVSQEALIATYSTGGASAGAARILVYYAEPA